MQNTAPKKEWEAPRIMRLDQLQNTETGSNPSIDESGHTVGSSFTSVSTNSLSFYGPVS